MFNIDGLPLPVGAIISNDAELHNMRRIDFTQRLKKGSKHSIPQTEQNPHFSHTKPNSTSDQNR
jgi:hypothetical protein